MKVSSRQEPFSFQLIFPICGLYVCVFCSKTNAPPELRIPSILSHILSNLTSLNTSFFYFNFSFCCCSEVCQYSLHPFHTNYSFLLHCNWALPHYSWWRPPMTLITKCKSIFSLSLLQVLGIWDFWCETGHFNYCIETIIEKKKKRTF